MWGHLPLDISLSFLQGVGRSECTWALSSVPSPEVCGDFLDLSVRFFFVKAFMRDGWMNAVHGSGESPATSLAFSSYTQRLSGRTGS